MSNNLMQRIKPGYNRGLNIIAFNVRFVYKFYFSFIPERGVLRRN